MKVIGGRYKGRELRTIKAIRPTLAVVRKRLFDMLQNIMEGAKVLDLFAGSGALGIEALSRGAASTVFVEREKKAIDCIRKNLISLRITPKQTHLLCTSAKNALQYCKRKQWTFDVIFIDPPYMEIDSIHPLLIYIDDEALLVRGGRLFLESASRHSIPPFQGKHLHFTHLRKSGNTQLQEYAYENSIDARNL